MVVALLVLGVDTELRAWRTWLEKWQTLITGFLALGGALMTVWVVLRQIDASNFQENERRERRLFAARAAMPAALSDMLAYVGQVVRILKSLRPAPGGDRVLYGTGWNAPTLPRPPADASNALLGCIEAAKGDAVSEIATLL